MIYDIFRTSPLIDRRQDLFALGLSGMGLQQFFIRQEEPQSRQHVSRVFQKGILLAEQPFDKGQGLFPIAAEEGVHEGEEVLFHGACKEIGQVVGSDALFPLGQGDAQFIEFGKDVEQRDAAPGLEQVLQKVFVHVG